MILTVTLNPALDLTYSVEGSLAVGHSHRVRSVEERPGGKGVNVARVLAALGEPVVAVGPGDAAFGRHLEAYGVPADFPPLLDRVRRSVAVVAGGDTTVFNEPGSPVVHDAAERLSTLVEAHLLHASALVVSGSLAPGLPDDLPVRLAEAAARHNVPAVLDLDDAPFAVAARAGGAVLMPNEHELARFLGVDAVPSDAVPAAVRALAASTGAPVVATLGAAGLVAAAGAELWRARPPAQVSGNPTGAGDATAAGVALGLARGLPWERLLPHAVALGAAAVLAPVAGEIDLAAYHRWVDIITVHRIEPPPPSPPES